MIEDEPSVHENATRIARLARCAAALYRTVPREGEGLTSQAAEIVHAVDLDALAASLEGGDVDGDDTALRPADIRAVCRLLLDVRRNPADVSEAERTVARRHFPEVEAESLDPLEDLVTFYTGLLDQQ
ncbi:MAG: hypothetical protein AB7R89_07195 [Dehalococcoidia bacterium]